MALSAAEPPYKHIYAYIYIYIYLYIYIYIYIYFVKVEKKFIRVPPYEIISGKNGGGGGGVHFPILGKYPKMGGGFKIPLLGETLVFVFRQFSSKFLLIS